MQDKAVVDRTGGGTEQSFVSAEYTEEFYKGLKRSHDSADIIVPIVLDLLGRERIHSVVDFGCGTGQWLAVFRDEGCEVTGFDSDRVESELLAIPNECFHAQDLTQAVRLDKRRDLAVSIEVAEHLDEQYADTFIDTITQASDIVLFSAAIPHQEGTHHVNCQWQSYWIAKFAERGYAVIDCIRPRVWSNDAVNLIYGQNMFVFCKDDKAKYGDILRLKGEVPDTMRNLVHPKIWEMYMPSRKTMEGEISNLQQQISSFQQQISSLQQHIDNMKGKIKRINISIPMRISRYLHKHKLIYTLYAHTLRRIFEKR